MTLRELLRQAHRVDPDRIDAPPPDLDPDALREQVLLTKQVMDTATRRDVEVAASYDENEVMPVVHFARDVLGVQMSPNTPREIDAFVQNNFIEPVLFRVKAEFAVPRPHVLAARFGIPYSMPVESRWLSAKSYPSGHAGGSRLAAHVLAYLYGSQLTGAQRDRLFEFANSVGFSRMQIGAHTPQDLIAAQSLADEYFALLTKHL
jgi:hypothetical protein